jgi:hypothetical protein
MIGLLYLYGTSSDEVESRLAKVGTSMRPLFCVEGDAFFAFRQVLAKEHDLLSIMRN